MEQTKFNHVIITIVHYASNKILGYTIGHSAVSERCSKTCLGDKGLTTMGFESQEDFSDFMDILDSIGIPFIAKDETLEQVLRGGNI